eukprot:TRINITY_DN20458_c0_g1_i1.p1 TRINITY_DN20458_c0_g1~~TRINITY_DN20458_c0_g1_i1.p1  ORF type:complete len:124 (-),score=21.99 TRINITY_DN20458_c0_g1_i1:108-479(-)
MHGAQKYPLTQVMGSETIKMVSMTQNEWQNGTFGCFSDPMTCVKGYFCAPCMICQNGEKVGKGGAVYFLLSCCFPVCAISMFRTATREKYGIDGSDAMDWGLGICLPACTNCQMALEHKARGN